MATSLALPQRFSFVERQPVRYERLDLIVTYRESPRVRRPVSSALTMTAEE